MILAGVAVSAVSGCVAVEPQPAPLPATEPPRLSRDVQPQILKPPIVQAPALEALDAALPPKPLPSATPRTSPRETPAARRTAPPAPPRQAPPARPSPPKAAAQKPRALPGMDALPPAPAAPQTDVCALGEGYGGWQPGSPEARICRETYGR